MPVEIQELVLQARVTDGETPDNDGATGLSCDERETLKSEIMADCARLIKREYARRNAR